MIPIPFDPARIIEALTQVPAGQQPFVGLMLVLAMWAWTRHRR